MATRRKVEQAAPGEIEALLPWYAAGTLSARESRLVEDALARDPALARQLDTIAQEQAETIRLNEDLGAPSPRAMQSLFAAIDAEPEQPKAAIKRRAGGIASFFASMSPRTFAWSAVAAAIVVVAQAAVIAAVLLRDDGLRPVQTASYDAPIQSNSVITRSMQPSPGVPAGAGPRATVRFAADARASEIAALLDAYQASVVGSARGGVYRLQFGTRGGAAVDAAAVIAQLQGERIVSFVGPAQ